MKFRPVQAGLCLAVAVVLISGVTAQVLNPPYFNIAEGRNITASATCGEGVPEPELFCKIVGSNWLDESDHNPNLIGGQACDYCDPNDPKKAHPPQYAIDGTERWWQSPPLSRGPQYSKVNLTLDLGQEFHVAYVFIKMGNSPRPGVWILEKSRDMGQTFQPWQYFADTPQDCSHFFGKHTLQPITKDDSVICETKFSKLVPLDNGEIAISLINGRPSAENFSMSPLLQEWTTATNIRLRFLRPKTTLGHLLSVAREEPTVTRRYFYSVKDINIGGQCVCNGHASQCDQSSPLDPLKLSCACQHHTCGLQCEKCCGGYQQYEWRRATIDDPFVCEKCNCHGHSNDCYYDPEVAAKNQSKNINGEYLGGGVCVNCQHNTTGINCDKCRDGFFRPRDKSLDAIDVCQPCECNPQFSTGNCFDETGQCECKINFQPPHCDQCSLGYYGYPECRECPCFPNGTIGDLCQLPESSIDGQCPCKQGYGGKNCKQCADGYYGFPDCRPCECLSGNVVNYGCDSETGQCHCKPNFGGRTCDKCNVGYYNYPRCETCRCAIDGSTKEICDSNTGQCYCRDGFEPPACDICANGFYGFPNCTRCQCNAEGSISDRCDNSNGKCQCKSNFGGLKCDDCAPGSYNFPKCEQCKCHWRGSTGIACDHSGNCFCQERYEGQKCDQCKEGYYNFPACEECNCNPAGLVAEFGGCDKVELGKLCECKERVKGRICNQCKDLYWNLQMNNPYGCEECNCNRNGTISHIGLCDAVSGKCHCKENVDGRTCNMCKRNTYQLDAGHLFGCVDCGCDIGGSINSDCDKNNGQCRCRSRIRGQTCNETIEASYFPTFYQFQYETEDWYNPGTGSPARFGYDEKIFPGYSWRGYAIFSSLQKEIFTNVTITKSSIYKIIVHYVNGNSEPVNGMLKFTPQEWTNEEEQTIPVTFDAGSQEPRFATGKQMSGGNIAMVADVWRLSLMVDKSDLYVDYVVLIPQAYYDPTLFQEGRTGPCLYPINPYACVKHSYPVYPERDGGSQTFPASEAMVNRAGEKIKPVTVDSGNYMEILEEKLPFVRLDEVSPNLEFEFSAPANGSNLAIINYHTPYNLDQPIPVRVMLENLDKPEQPPVESEITLSACPYLFACRHLVTSNEGRMLTFDAMANDRFRLHLQPKSTLPPNQQESQRRRRLEPETSSQNLNVNGLTVMPYNNKWSFNYIEPKFVCIYKNESCTGSNFPPISEGLKIEAEANQPPERVIQLDNYVHSALPNSETKPLLVFLNDTNPTVDIRGTVPKPGPYYFILNYYQPRNPSSRIEASIQDGHFYSGEAKLRHCPDVVGCREALKQRDTEIDLPTFNIHQNFLLTLKIPKANDEVYLDYLLLVPGEKFDPKSLISEPVDSSKNIMAECLQNNYFVDPEKTSEHCRSLIFSTTVAFNGGALPCDCNIDGSFDHKCEAFGGQCKCKPNVIGRDCSKCQTGYYGFPNCKKCDCPSTAICHHLTGACICPKGVTGKDCDKCLPLTFGFDRILGCVDCGCNPRGVQNRDLRCNVETGECTCMQNIVGRTCDKCRPGFFGFPNCQLCRCDIRGVIPEICDQNTARCFCKKNVAGISCDGCKSDSYYLEENNQNGCTKCFCFGNSDRCISSAYVFVPVVPLDAEPELLNLTVSENSLEARRLKKNEDYELDFLPDRRIQIRISLIRDQNGSEYSAVYMSLPKEYLGKKITSYGARLNYSIVNKIVNHRDSEASPALPDIILIGKNHTFIHEHLEQPVMNENFFVTMKLLEKEFKRLDGQPVSREQFMMALVDLQQIYVRIKYFESSVDPIDIEMEPVQMEVGVQPGNKIMETTRRALSVEQCRCPPSYRGTSCEECAEGYYRIQRGPYLGDCVPCNCHGHSNECDPVTGKCFNCKYNTEGDHCQQCVAGYYGDATHGTPNDCLICACPLPVETNNFATSCEVSPSGSVLSCNCKEGYNGTRCEICSAGHYGQPQVQGKACQRCECSNNIDITDSESCDPYTGICQKCLYNSAGPHCERCADWYYGDSVTAKNCTQCSCDQCGSEYCDHKTATCKCKPNVIGQNCDQCAAGFYGFSTCQGCRPCNCGEASHDMSCDDSGQCSCKTGAAGKTCGTCAPGFWGYSKYGCTSCGCNEKYSRVKQCNQFTGQCQCLPGVVGAKCESCPDRWVLVPESGCKECNECVHALLNETDMIENMIEDNFQFDKQETSSSVLAYRKLNNVKDRFANYSKELGETFAETDQQKERLAKFKLIKTESQDLEKKMDNLDLKTGLLKIESDKILQKTVKALNDSTNARNNVAAVRQLTAQVVDNVMQLEQNFPTAMESASTYQNNMALVEESEQILNELKKPYIDEQMGRFKIDARFNRTLAAANNFSDQWLSMKEDIETAGNRLNNMSSLLAELKNLTTMARSDTVGAERIIKQRLKEATILAIDKLKSYVDKSIAAIEEGEKYNQKSQDNLRIVLAMEEDIEQQKRALEEFRGNLENRLKQMIQESPELEHDVMQAEEHARRQVAKSGQLNQLFASTKNQATDPLKAANSYDNISNTIQYSEEALNEMREKYRPYESSSFRNDFLPPADLQPISQNTLENLRNSTNRLRELENNINDTERVITGKEEEFSRLKLSFENLDSASRTKRDTAIVKQKVPVIEEKVKEVSETETRINNIIEAIEQLKLKSKDIKDYSDFVNDVKEGKDFVDRFEKDVEKVKNITGSNDIEQMENEFSRKRSKLSGKIADLKKRIQLARHQANSIRVGVKFSHGSYLELNNPANLVESATYNKFSMQFKDEYPEGILAYIGNPYDANAADVDGMKRKRQISAPEVMVDENNVVKPRRKTINYDYMAVELRGGRVFLAWDLGAGDATIIEDEQNVFDNKWHQVVVERFGRLIKLSVVTDNHTTVTQELAPGSTSVFNLDRENSKIFIGGIPPGVKLNQAVSRRNFYGIISNVYLDNEPLGLWNSKASENVQGAHAYEMFSDNTVRFNGNSYVILARHKDLNFKETVYVSFQFKTFNKNGLLFLVGDPSRKVYFAIELNNGKLVVKYELGSAFTIVSSSESYNDGQWHFVKVNREGKECLINVDNRDEQSAFSMGLSTDLYTDDNIYVGGYRGLNPYYDVTKEGFDGCIKDLQIDSIQQNMNHHKEAFGMTFGCQTFVRVVSFAEQAKAYVLFSRQNISTVDTFGMVQITFKFRTLSKTGLLLYFTDENRSGFSLDVHLSDGMLLLRMDTGKILQTENQFYNDNKWHYITISFNQKSLEMNVDDLNSFSLELDSALDVNRIQNIYVGGLPDGTGNYNQLPVTDFVGCIGDVTINTKFMNFADADSHANAQFKRCPLAANEEEISLSSFKDMIAPETHTNVPSVQYLPPFGNCKLPPIPQQDGQETNESDQDAYRFGSTLWSRVEFPINDVVAKALESESGFQLEFKTSQSEGILFYMTSTNNIDFVGLYFLNGRLHYSFDCGSGRGVVSSPGSYNDSEWHKVTFTRKGAEGMLRVDDKEGFEVASVGKTSSLNVKSPIYLGGIPKELRSQVKGHLKGADKNDYAYAITSFAGCLKNLQVRDLAYPFTEGRAFDVGPCFGQVESGHFFHHEGGYIRLFEEFRVRVEFTLVLDVKPRKPDGILAAVFGKSDYLILYLDKGKLYFAVDNGADPIIASADVHNRICDGQWHHIKAFKTKNIIMLTVDDLQPVASYGKPGISSTDTRNPLYIGGLPAKLKEEKARELNNVKDDYLGCLRIRSINGQAEALGDQAKIEGHVSLNTCSTA